MVVDALDGFPTHEREQVQEEPRQAAPQARHRPNSSRRHAFANIPAIEIDIGIPHTRKLATPMIVQVECNDDELPNAARTRSVSGWCTPNSWTNTVPGLAFLENPEK